jgi:putative endonuclease
MSETPEDHCAAGRRGEDAALRFLQGKGFRLVKRNYRSGRSGEIDLVMDDPEGVLVFVEVKSNRGAGSGHPLERIDGRKIRRIQRLAQKYCWEHRQENRDMRFDVVGVELRSGTESALGVEEVEHIENAFLPHTDGYYPSR